MPKIAEQSDVYVGNMLRVLRRQRGLSQEQLATDVKVKFQQIHKYEIGANRISVSKLTDISITLDVSPLVFFNVKPQSENIANLSLEEQDLVGSYRKCSSEGQCSLINIASTLRDATEVRTR